MAGDLWAGLGTMGGMTPPSPAAPQPTTGTSRTRYGCPACGSLQLWAPVVAAGPVEAAPSHKTLIEVWSPAGPGEEVVGRCGRRRRGTELPLTADELACLSQDPRMEDEYYICAICSAFFDFYRLTDADLAGELLASGRPPLSTAELAERVRSTGMTRRRRHRRED